MITLSMFYYLKGGLKETNFFGYGYPWWYRWWMLIDLTYSTKSIISLLISYTLAIGLVTRSVIFAKSCCYCWSYPVVSSIVSIAALVIVSESPPSDTIPCSIRSQKSLRSERHRSTSRQFISWFPMVSMSWVFRNCRSWHVLDSICQFISSKVAYGRIRCHTTRMLTSNPFPI